MRLDTSSNLLSLKRSLREMLEIIKWLKGIFSSFLVRYYTLIIHQLFFMAPQNHLEWECLSICLKLNEQVWRTSLLHKEVGKFWYKCTYNKCYKHQNAFFYTMYTQTYCETINLFLTAAKTKLLWSTMFFQVESNYIRASFPP